jgi:hypothetical protein
MMEVTNRGVASQRSVETKRKHLARGETRQMPLGRVNECLLDSSAGNRDSKSGEFRQESSTSTESIVVVKCYKRLGTIG